MTTTTSGSILGRLLAPHGERAYAAMRIVAGALFTFHGLQKIFGLLGGQQPPVMSQLWIGGVLELATGILVAIGLLTRWAAFIASGMMAVAYFQFHWKLQLGEAFFPIVNKGEMAVLYCFVFLYVACKGSGSASLDGRRAG